MSSGTALADEIGAALFILPARRLGEALCRLPVGFLWNSCLPGMDPEATLRTLGPSAEDALRQAACAWAGADGAMLAANAGLPFSVDTAEDLAPLGEALLTDARALIAQSPSFGPVPLPDGGADWSVEVVHRPRSEWNERVLACLDHAASDAFGGVSPDPVYALLRSPEHDLSGIIPLADPDVRLRFIEGVVASSEAVSPMDQFRRSHWRRGAAAGLLTAVEAALTGPRGSGRVGRSADGWPSWWFATGSDPTVILAALAPAVVADALDVRTSMLPGPG